MQHNNRNTIDIPTASLPNSTPDQSQMSFRGRRVTVPCAGASAFARVYSEDPFVERTESYVDCDDQVLPNFKRNIIHRHYHGNSSPSSYRHHDRPYASEHTADRTTPPTPSLLYSSTLPFRNHTPLSSGIFSVPICTALSFIVCFMPPQSRDWLTLWSCHPITSHLPKFCLLARPTAMSVSRSTTVERMLLIVKRSVQLLLHLRHLN